MAITLNPRPLSFISPSSILPSSSRSAFFLSPLPRTTRRLFLPSVSGIWDALTGASNSNNSRETLLSIRRGMLLFRQVRYTTTLLSPSSSTTIFVIPQSVMLLSWFLFVKGNVSASLAEFDKAIHLDPRQKACMYVVRLFFFFFSNAGPILEYLYMWANLHGIIGYIWTFWLMTDLWQRGLSLYYLDRYLLMPLLYLSYFVINVLLRYTAFFAFISHSSPLTKNILSSMSYYGI